MDDTKVAPAILPSQLSTLVASADDISESGPMASPNALASISEAGDATETPPVPAEIPAVARAADLSGSVSKEATPNSSTRDESQSESAPYTTRSRNRGNVTRPNYADDVEMDFEVPLAKQKALPEKRRSTSAGLAAAPVTARESKGPTIRLYTSSNSVNGTTQASTSTKSTKAAQSSTADPPPERKKRKYERHTTSQTLESFESRTAAIPSNQMIPGTSQFSAAPSGSNDAPPSKRRKTGDDVNKAAGSSQAVQNGPRETSIITFETNGLILNDGKLTADDGSTYSANDHIYLVCEPPGDPYYICRIMAFHFAEPDDPRTPVVSLLINWFYRPKDINRYSSDHRFLYASMQSDEVPIHSLRGRCRIEHRSQISSVEEYRKQRDSFWFSQLYDRYSHRPYEMIPSSAVINVPENVKKALDDNWKFLVVEQARQKELTSAAKLCKRCSRYCAPNGSVDCGVCRETYHMACVDPPLSKKPSRGFAWSCGPCSRAQERKLEERHTTVLANASVQAQDEIMEDEEGDTARTSEAPQQVDSPTIPDPLPEKTENASANMWPWRYLGIHSRVEDVLQYDDRAIYPRASSRLGPRHQAATAPWFGQPVEYVKPSELRRKAAKNKKDSKLSKDMLAAIDADRAERAKRPKWIQDEPQGYIPRGEDYDEGDPRCTATPLFIKPPHKEQPSSGFMAANVRGPPNDKMIDEYLNAARELADKWGHVVKSKRGDPQVSTNYLDRALKVLSENKFNFSASLESLKAHHEPALLGDPNFTKEEVKKFEDGIAKYGSDLRSVRKFHVKSRPYRDVVRFYYTWKFTERGQQVWGNNQGRKSVKRRAQTSWIDIADDEDDSAFDTAKALHRKRNFHCNFCATRNSRQWRRAPGVTPGQTILLDPKGGKEKANQLVLALCQRCAHLWRRYGLPWEDPDDIAKSVIQSGGRAWKRKNDEEMLRELVLANEATEVPTSIISTQAAAAIGITITITHDSIKKKVKNQSDKESTPNQGYGDQSKKKAPPVIVPRPATPPPEPVPPKWRELPCTICRYLPLPNEQVLTCRECKLTAHPRCYAVTEVANPSRWVCDTCLNDRHTQHSLNYTCTLCPMADRPTDLLEPPKVTHKKKTDRDREKERLEKEMAVKMEEDYFRDQKRKGRPIYPREAIKLTSANNWIHITCAVWTPEIKFSDGAKMQRSEGMGAVVANPARMESTCRLCRIDSGSCVSCHSCHAPFHVSCAHEHGYTFGFDIAPVKGARKDHPQHLTLGQESGFVTAAIWCKEHTVKTVVHDMTAVVNHETGKTVLQFYSELYKQADLSLTGTVRNAQLLAGATKGAAGSRGSTNGASRRISLVNGADPPKGNAPEDDTIDQTLNGALEQASINRRCKTCGIDASLRWHQLLPNTSMMNGTNGFHVSEWQCHKCYPQNEQNSQSRPTDDESNEIPEALQETPDLFRATQLPARSYMSPESVETFAADLVSVTLTLTNPVFGGLHVFRGKDFGLDLNADPTPLFRFISHYAALKCGYDQERDVIITEDGSWVTWPKSMMQALVKIIMSGSKEAHWRVVSARDIPCKIMDTSYLQSLQMRDFVPHQMPGAAPQGQGAPRSYDYRPGFSPAPRAGYPPHLVQVGHPGDPHLGSLPSPQHSFPPAPSIPGVTPARRPSLNYGRPADTNGTGLPPQSAPGRPPTYPPPDALTAVNRPPPFYASGPGAAPPIQMSPTQGAMRPPSPTAVHGAPRPVTPRETTYNQASSSPNLRNILH